MTCLEEGELKSWPAESRHPVQHNVKSVILGGQASVSLAKKSPVNHPLISMERGSTKAGLQGRHPNKVIGEPVR